MKKFIKVSLLMCISIILLIGFFTIKASDLNDILSSEGEISYLGTRNEIDIEYEGYKEEKDFHIITVSVKNNTKNILNMYDMELSFEPMDTSGSMDQVYFKGDREGYLLSFEEDKMGIDPGDKKNYVFKVSKGITFDEEKFMLDQPIIGYNASMYKVRTSNSSLAFGFGSIGGSRTLNMDNY